MLEKMKQKYHRIQKFHFWVYTRRICKQNFRQLQSSQQQCSQQPEGGNNRNAPRRMNGDK